ncbi:MAG: hypothetical protein ACLR43_14860 [Faecalibacillus faecis]
MNVRLTIKLCFAIEHVLNEELALEMKQKLIEQIGECEILVKRITSCSWSSYGYWWYWLSIY